MEIVRQRRDRTDGADDIGSISAEEASQYLLTLARTGATERGARAAILPAVLADVEETWRDLVDLGTDRGLPDAVRKRALFWLGQEAAETATEGLADIALDEEGGSVLRGDPAQAWSLGFTFRLAHRLRSKSVDPDRNGLRGRRGSRGGSDRVRDNRTRYTR